MIYILADDLTGASDTGIQFSKKGNKTIIVIMNHDSPVQFTLPEKADVLVIDTETREVEEKLARLTIRKILPQLNLKKEDLVFKKIDSTLRGNIGAEIEEIMNITKKDFCILNPSFPSQQRITVGGYLVVQQKLLGFSEYSSDQTNPEENSYIPALIKKQTNLEVAHINLIKISKGKDELVNLINTLPDQNPVILVTDSTNDKHLKIITQSGLQSNHSILFAGSAGMAQYLAKIPPRNKLSRNEIHENDLPILMLGGSRRSIMTKQIRFLKNKIPIKELVIDLEKIFSHQEKMLNLYAKQGIQNLKANQDLVIHTNPNDNQDKSIDELIMKKYRLNFRELETEIKDFIGKLTSIIIDHTGIFNLLLTGGDIALSVCKSLGINNLELIQEILPGIPVSLGFYQNHFLNIITKAGGFGEENTLYKIIMKFRNLDKTEEVFTYHEPEKC